MLRAKIKEGPPMTTTTIFQRFGFIATAIAFLFVGAIVAGLI